MTKAAAALGIGQPHVSRAIAQLEAELGFELFIRGHGSATPTLEGEAFAREASTWSVYVLTGYERFERFYGKVAAKKRKLAATPPPWLSPQGTKRTLSSSRRVMRKALPSPIAAPATASYQWCFFASTRATPTKVASNVAGRPTCQP